MIKVLYIHDYENWAIHKVGQLWLNDQECISVTYIQHQSLKKIDLNEFDIVWFGFSTIYKWTGQPRHSCVVVSIHDPTEIFNRDHQYCTDCHIVTTSRECEYLLNNCNLKATIIPTAGNLPIRHHVLELEPLKLISINSGSKRKNVEGLQSLFSYFERHGIKSTLKVGYEILSEDDYINLLDSHNLYVCMSNHEGGPIPAMEAMSRGCTVISTNVGQMPELLDGSNGLISDINSFIPNIENISLDKLLEMRKSAINTIIKKRDVKTIRMVVNNFVSSLLQS